MKKFKLRILSGNLSAAGFVSPPDLVEVEARQSHLRCGFIIKLLSCVMGLSCVMVLAHLKPCLILYHGVILCYGVSRIHPEAP